MLVMTHISLVVWCGHYYIQGEPKTGLSLKVHDSCIWCWMMLCISKCLVSFIRNKTVFSSLGNLNILCTSWWNRATLK